MGRGGGGTIFCSGFTEITIQLLLEHRLPVTVAEADAACFPSLPSQRHSLHLDALFPFELQCFFLIPHAVFFSNKKEKIYIKHMDTP